MALNQDELDLLATLLDYNSPKDGYSNHGSLLIDGIDGDHAAIAVWMDQVPVADLARFSYPLRDTEISDYYAIENFQLWISGLYGKLGAETNVPISGYTQSDLRYLARQFDKKIFEYYPNTPFNTITMRDLVIYLYQRKFWDILNNLLTLCTTEGFISVNSALKIQVEMSGASSGLKRWESLGISAAPTEAEVSTVLNP